MGATTCAEPECDRPLCGRGLCGTHYAYRRRHGTLPPKVRPSPEGCSVDGCGGRHEARGLCPMHYQRLTKRGGNLSQPLATASDEVRFWAKVDRSAGEEHCWPWLAGISAGTGYGNIWWLGRTQAAHRISYQLLRGEIPAGLTLDHLCRTRTCVNPWHLEAVTHKVNVQRGDSPGAIAARENICQRGHEFTPENTYVRPGRGTRSCKACARERDRGRLPL